MADYTIITNYEKDYKINKHRLTCAFFLFLNEFNYFSKDVFIKKNIFKRRGKEILYVLNMAVVNDG